MLLACKPSSFTLTDHPRLFATQPTDLPNALIELTGKTTKNKKARYLPIYGDMAAEIEMAISLGDPKCPLLVQREGKPVFDFEKSWKTACDFVWR